MSEDSPDIEANLDITGIEPDVDQKRVLDLYQTNAATFIRKNEDYGSSFVTSGMIQSLYEHGEIIPEAVIENICQQMFTRMQDKQARIYQQIISDTDQHVADESSIDTLLDLANYSIMLASQLIKYQEGGFQGQHPETEAMNKLGGVDFDTMEQLLAEFGQELAGAEPTEEHEDLFSERNVVTAEDSSGEPEPVLNQVADDTGVADMIEDSSSEPEPVLDQVADDTGVSDDSEVPDTESESYIDRVESIRNGQDQAQWDA